jgi:hypothetical protein
MVGFSDCANVLPAGAPLDVDVGTTTMGIADGLLVGALVDVESGTGTTGGDGGGSPLVFGKITST